MSLKKSAFAIFAIIFSLILSAYILEINSRPFVKKHVIFKVQTGDGKGLAFLMGSIHGGNVDISSVIPQLEELERKIGALAIEDYSDTPILHIITGTKENGAFAYATQDEREVLEDLFAVFRKKSIRVDWEFEAIHPSAFAPIWYGLRPNVNASWMPKVSSPVPLDQHLIAFASEKQWPVRKIETREQLFRALVKQSAKGGVRCLIGYADLLINKDLQQRDAKLKLAELNAYLQQNIEMDTKLAFDYNREILKCPSGYVENEMLERNKTMVAAIMASLYERKAVFFAPGFSHLGGDVGIVHLLKAEGLTVVPLE